MKREQKAITAYQWKSLPRHYLQKIYRIAIAAVLGILMIGAHAKESSGILDPEIMQLKNGQLSAPICENTNQTEFDWLGQIVNTCTVNDGANDNGGKYEQGDFDFVSHSS